MKKIIGTLAIYASLAIVALASFANVSELKAQTPTPAQTPAAAQTPAPAAQTTCTDEAKAPLYAEFMKYRTTTETPKANDAAKKYLAICTQDDQYTSYLKKWTTAYEKSNRKLKFQPVLYGDKKYDEAFAMGKQILADEPENLRVTIDLGYAGFHLAGPAAKSESYNADSLMYSRKAIQMIEAGKTPESLDEKTQPWNPFKGKDDTLAYLYHGVGRMQFKSNPEEALTALIKALQFETDLKKEAWEYYFIGAGYETGTYAKLATEYEKFKGKEETPESKLLLANINQVVDRMVDAYARAVSLAGSDPKFAASKKEWTETLSNWYKFRHNQTDTGMTEMIASVMSKPLPPVPTPITILPAAPAAPAATATPSPGSATNSAGSTPTSGAAAPPAANTMTTTTTPLTSPTTAAIPKTTNTVTTTGVKPKTRNNHRRQ